MSYRRGGIYGGGALRRVSIFGRRVCVYGDGSGYGYGGYMSIVMYDPGSYCDGWGTIVGLFTFCGGRKLGGT